jgi:hypothetical protein
MEKKYSAVVIAALLLTGTSVAAQSLTPVTTAPVGRTSWLGENGASQAPFGMCVTELHIHQDPANNIPYRFNGLASDGVTRIGFPIGVWDVMGSGYANMSAKIDSIWSGECLSDVQFVYATRGVEPAAPPTPLDGGNAYVRLHSFKQPHIWTPSRNDSDRVIGAVYVQKMNPNSQRIVTGVTLPFGGQAWCTRPPMAPGYTVECLGSWKGEGAPDSPNVYNWLMVSKGPANPPASRAVTGNTGKWVKLSSCRGCNQTEYALKIGVTSGRTTMSGREMSHSINVSATLGYSSGTAVTQASGTVTAGYTWTSTTRSEITDSFQQTAEREAKYICAKNGLYQWETSATFSGVPGTVTANTLSMVCSSAPGTEVDANRTNPLWSPSDEIAAVPKT